MVEGWQAEGAPHPKGPASPARSGGRDSSSPTPNSSPSEVTDSSRVHAFNDVCREQRHPSEGKGTRNPWRGNLGGGGRELKTDNHHGRLQLSLLHVYLIWSLRLNFSLH